VATLVQCLVPLLLVGLIGLIQYLVDTVGSNASSSGASTAHVVYPNVTNLDTILLPDGYKRFSVPFFNVGVGSAVGYRYPNFTQTGGVRLAPHGHMIRHIFIP
jgi:hypothetical protein